MRFQKL